MLCSTASKNTMFRIYSSLTDQTRRKRKSFWGCFEQIRINTKIDCVILQGNMIQKTLFFFTLLFLASNHNFAQKTEIINYDEVYAFIHSTQLKDSLTFNLIENMNLGVFSDDTSDFLTDSLFNKDDIAYFREQLALMDNVKWQNGKITGATIITENDINKTFKKKNGWERFRKKHGNCLTSYSLPLFNTTFEYCIFYHWTQCDYLAGGGRLDLYKRSNGKWKYARSYNIGVS